jgi:membrane-bound serine protease (ClpP class)
MRNVLRAARAAAVTLMVFALTAAGTRAQTQAPTVLKLRLSGVVDPFTADYVRAGIETANAQRDAAVLLTIDTPGGLDSSMREIVQAILGSRIPVICYVSPEGARAASAGTFIMMGCPVAAMAPGTNIGAAHPVGVAGAIEEQKVTNDAAAYIQDLAHRNGRNEAWAKDAVVNSVSIPSNEALTMGVIDLVEPSEGALLRALEGRVVQVADGRTVTLHVAGARVETLGMGVGAAILHTLLSPDFAFIFFYLGLGLIVIELLHPGLSIPGILGALSLVAAFVTFGLLPVQIVGVVLLLASALFFLLELKHPGLGLATVGGVACLVLGGLTLFNPSVPNARVSLWVIVPVAGFLVLFFGTVVNAALRARRLPKAIGVERLLGQEGVVERELAPDGVVLVASEEWSARSTAGVLPAGTRVRVVGVDRLRLDVTPIEHEAPASPGPERGNP